MQSDRIVLENTALSRKTYYNLFNKNVISYLWEISQGHSKFAIQNHGGIRVEISTWPNKKETQRFERA